MARHDLDPGYLGSRRTTLPSLALSAANVFLVSALLHRDGRACPGCGRSTAQVEGGAKSGGRLD